MSLQMRALLIGMLGPAGFATGVMALGMSLLFVERFHGSH
jgi:hypothetical protein